MRWRGCGAPAGLLQRPADAAWQPEAVRRAEPPGHPAEPLLLPAVCSAALLARAARCMLAPTLLCTTAAPWLNAYGAVAPQRCLPLQVLLSLVQR